MGNPLLKLDQPRLESLMKLRSDSDFKRFEEALQEYERELVDRTVTSTDPIAASRAAGGVVVLREVLQAIVSAPAALESLQKRRNTR